MIGHVKKFRQDIVDSGVDDKEYYIRIRPEDRNGKLRIRGDIKKKDSGRFETKAYWCVPAMDANLNSANPELIKPIFVNSSGSGQSNVSGPGVRNRSKSRSSFRGNPLPPPAASTAGTSNLTVPNSDNVFDTVQGN
jgi:hypothetical protein